VIVWGIKPYQVGYGNPPQTREMVEKRIYHADTQRGKDWKPLLVGSNVNRYSCQFPGNLFIKYGPGLMYSSNERLMRGPKILMRQTSDVLRCCFDDEGYYCQNSVFIVHSDALNLHFLLGLLNSKLLGFVYTNANPQTGKVFAEVKPSVIKGLPIRRIKSPSSVVLHDRIAELVGRIVVGRKMDAQMETSAFEREIDQQVYALYGLTPEEIAIVEGVKK
jgi:adenine-specific DNA-methyltransferase